MKEERKKREPLDWALTLGIIFEIWLVVAVLLRLSGNWFFVEFYNLAMVCHYPLMWLAQTDSEALGMLLLVGYASLMAYLWAWLFRRLAACPRKLFPKLAISRRTKLFLKAGVAVCVAAALAWPFVQTALARPVPFTPSPDAKKLVEGNDAFALDLYQRLKDGPDNLFFSPYSISTGLGMVYAGARGTTERELAGALHFELAQDRLPPAFGELAGRLNGLQRWNHIRLRTADSLWYQRDYAFKPAYLDLLRNDYRAEARAVDFKQAPQDAGREMAAWIEKNTGGRIKNAVDPGLLDVYTRLLLCDTIYFKGRWASEFKRNITYPRDFFINASQSVTTPMMSQAAEFKMWDCDEESPRMQILEMPYYGGDLSMVILLPEAMDGLAGVEMDLNATNLNRWLRKLDEAPSGKTTVALPRFTMTRMLDLPHVLRSMGVREVFGGGADLSGMDVRNHLYLDQIIHQAFVDVNEEGTEAAAVTFAQVKSKGMVPRLFLANHPFVFLIRDNATGSILFLGRLVDPTKS